MAVQYIVIPWKDPKNPAATPVYYPRARTSGAVGVRELAEEIATISTLSTADIVAALEGLLLVIPKHIAEGKLVRLGELGTFRLTLQCEGSETPEAVTEKNIKSIRLRFRPGKVFKRALAGMRYKKVNR